MKRRNNNKSAETLTANTTATAISATSNAMSEYGYL
jgi:hypothetical protein